MKDIIDKLRLDAGIARVEGTPYLVCVSKDGKAGDPLEGLQLFANLIIQEFCNKSTFICKCYEQPSIFNSVVIREHKSECSAGGGVARWVECKCKICEREWEEPGLL